jgi:hypothetical protein
MQATAAIIGDLTGREVSKTPLAYFGNCVSLGQKDGIFQPVDGGARSTSWALRGRTAARFKAFVLRGSAWNIAHPTYGLPTRRHRLVSAPTRSAEVFAD